MRACTRSISRRSRRSPSTSRAIWRSRSREMGLPMRLETRTGDTPASKRQRQRRDPPDILLTTPEQLALLLASADAPYLFGDPEARRARRAAFAGHLQARRSAVARHGAAVRAGAGDDDAWDCRRRWPSRRSSAVFWCRSRSKASEDLPKFCRSGRLPKPARAERDHAAIRRSICPGPAIRRATRSPRFTISSRRTRPRSFSSTRAARPSSYFSSSGASMTTISP